MGDDLQCTWWTITGTVKNVFTNPNTYSTGAGFVPILGDAKDLQEAITGEDLITGESIGGFWRGASLVAAAVPFLPGKGIRELSGQIHHVVSRRIARAVESHPVLAGKYAPRDSRFVTQAADILAHRGYQRWHIDLDAEVSQWLAANPNAAEADLEAFLQWRYSQPDLLERFPNGF